MEISNCRRYLDRSDIKYVVMVFMYIFYFRLQRVQILRIIDSTILLGIILFGLLLFNNTYMNKYLHLMQKIYSLRIIVSCSVLILLAVSITSINRQYEFSICKTLFHQLIFIIIGIELYSYLQVKNRQDNVVEYIIVSYVIQSFIQYASFLIPEVSTFTDMFKTKDIIELKLQYAGFRLNAISGAFAFGLAMGYAVVITLLLFRWKEVKIKKKVSTLIILLAGGVAAGRTSILMSVITIAFIVLYKIINTLIIGRLRVTNISIYPKTIFWLIIVGIGGSTIVPRLFRWLNSNTEWQTKFNTILLWLVKWKANYFGIGKTKTNSYDFWTDNYSVFNQIQNIIIGNGIYSNPDGTYYLHVDAGYIRILAFGGIVWGIALLIHQILILNVNPKRRYECFVLLVLLLIGTIKADCLGMVLSVIVILTLTGLSNQEEKFNGGVA